MAIAIKLDDLLYDRWMTLTELADGARGTRKSNQENIK